MGRLLVGVGVALATAMAGRAEASAWLAAEEGQEIITSSAGKRDGVTVFESSAYWEAPLGEDVTGVIAPWTESAADLESGWRGEAVVGVKRAIFRDDHSVMALQTGAFWRSDPPGSWGEGGMEVRWLGGRSYGRTGFVNVEAAAPVLDEGCPTARFSLAAGYKPDERWLAMGELFYESPREGSESLKLQVSLVGFGDDGRGIQLGLRAP